MIELKKVDITNDPLEPCGPGDGAFSSGGNLDREGWETLRDKPDTIGGRMALNALLGKHNDKRATRQHVHRTINEGIDGL